MLATINMQYSAARDLQIAPEPIKTSLIHIFEENEIRLTKKEDAEDSFPSSRILMPVQVEKNLKT